MKITKTKFYRSFLSQAMNGALKCVEGAMRVLPRPLVQCVVEGAFAVACLGTRRLNQICVKNLQRVYGNAKSNREYKAVAHAYVKSVGHSMMDLLYYVERPEALSKIVSFEYEENLKKALAQGRGVIAVSAHLSNFPLMFVSLVQKGYKVNVIIRRMRDPQFSKFMFNLCTKWGINMIQTAPPKQFFRESLGALKRNELLFILLDEVVAKEDGVKVQFFNREVTRAPGPMLFFKRTGSPILPMFIVKEPNKHYKIFIEEPLKVHEAGTPEENIVRNIATLTTIIEGYVRRYPLQWGGWLNKRWSLENIADAAHVP
jgi:Kdo2-lipid IVA lauroyltransferase/acyltransferase